MLIVASICLWKHMFLDDLEAIASESSQQTPSRPCSFSYLIVCTVNEIQQYKKRWFYEMLMQLKY